VGHQLKANDVGRLDVSLVSHPVNKGPGRRRPDRVDVTLRIELDTLAVRREVDRQLRHSQDRLRRVHQGEAAVSQGQSPGDAEITIQPRVEPCPAIRLQRDDPETVTAQVVVLFETKVGAVGVTADDTKRLTWTAVRLCRPGHQRSRAHDVEAPAVRGPLVTLV